MNADENGSSDQRRVAAVNGEDVDRGGSQRGWQSTGVASMVAVSGVTGLLSGQQSGEGESNVLPSFYVVLRYIWYKKKVGDLPLQVGDLPRGVGELD
jgi:hypothetical protein